MPKNLNYPLASFQKAFTLADAVDALGGSCSVENCAQKMQRKVSGGFMVIISSAQKFQLVSFEKGIITTSSEYKLIKHSYTNSERLALLRKAFLVPQVFSILFERFKGRELPTEMLDKILIREFGVEENTAGRVAGYFIEGLKAYGLLNGNVVVEEDQEVTPNKTSSETVNNVEPVVLSKPVEKDEKPDSADASFITLKSDRYEIQLSGPGINGKFIIEDEEGLLIAEAILKKIKKVIKGGSKV
ncbi:hypothetical protein [Mucilaginibacter arboris]|uniref:Uncharacterized protein n=1 Tax=Mucilaginibacter arboris TaxID=2682090 RepID=A0A7K1SY88_9SPHI|nr:hypothetical protein [Mucilaginibacter arboris]MVN21990.1 hypothetical protein [Mucilaginibacter arboris]